MTIQDHIARNFQNNFMISVKNNFHEGSKFSQTTKFIFSAKTPKFLHSSNTITIRFLCELKELLKTHDLIEFSEKIDSPQKQPIFVMIPYFYENLEENDEYLRIYQSSFECTIVYNLNTQEFEDSYRTYKSSQKFKDLKENIQKILKEKEKPRISSYLKNKFNRKTYYLKESSFEDSKQHILFAIEKTIEKMKKGECYLANLTQRYDFNDNENFFSAKQFLEKWFLQRPQFGIWISQPDCKLACFSPERFLIRHSHNIATEPIKGTQEKFLPSLWKNQKEMSEHTMAVDLLRHDLNSICKPGSVKVVNPFYIKKCYHLLQMQTSIVGKISKNQNISNILLKMLPGGSITGTPKKRVCQIIHEYENKKRGYYTGIAGIIEPTQNFDFTILIRSLFFGRYGIYTGVGAGITTLSSPEKEFKEFILKIKSFL